MLKAGKGDTMSGAVNRGFRRRPEAALGLVVAALLLLGACAGEVGVADARAGYIAEMRSFTVQAPVGDEGAMAEEAEAEAEAAAGDEAVEEGDMPAEPETVNVLLDILVHNEGSGTLEGVTVDLTIADPDGAEKERRLLWVETAGLTKGSQSQEVLEVNDLAYTEGDGFHVEVRHPIPMEERGDYREFEAEN